MMMTNMTIENNTIRANYIMTLNIDEPLARIKADGTIRYYHQDALGSVMALTDENGVMKTQYTYEPYGNATVSGEADDNPIQYTGRENDNTGLYYYRARYYSPEMQRFVSEDPIGLDGGINKYVYVENSPINFIDLIGLVCGSSGTDWLLPDKWPTYDFTSCCQKHDECYGCKGKDQGTSKCECDRKFCECLLKTCEKLTGTSKKSCEGNAKLYCWGVKRLGDGAFSDARKNCK
jgi:RHS repeat-associated protein